MRTQEEIARDVAAISVVARKVILGLYQKAIAGDLPPLTERGVETGKYLSEHPELLQS